MRFLYYILFFVTPLVVYHKTSELFEFNKMILIYLIAASATFLWIVTVKNTKTITLPIRIFMLSGGTFLLSQIISTFISIDVHTSLFGYYGRFNGGLASIISYFLLFFVFIQTFESKDVYKFLKVSILSSIIVMLLGIPGKFGFDLLCLAFTGVPGNSCWVDQFRPAERMFSTLGQPNWLGAYLAIHFFLGLFFFLITSCHPERNEVKSKSRSPQATEDARSGRSADLSRMRDFPTFVGDSSTTLGMTIWTLYLILNFACILFTRSDAAMVAVFVGLIIFALLYLCMFGTREVFHFVHKTKFLMVAFLALTFAFGTGISPVDRVIDRLKHTTTSQSKNVPNKQALPYDARRITDSFEIRKIVWKGAIEIGKRYPLFGTGVETFAYAYPIKRPVEHNLTSEWDFIYNKAHNEFLNYFATTGFVGIISYLGMIGSVIFLAVRAIRQEKDPDTRLFGICLLSSYVSIHVANFFGFSTTTIQLFFYLIPAFFMVVFYGETLQKVHFSYPRFISFVFVPAIVVAFVYVIGFLLLYYMADLRYALADRYIRTGEYQKGSQLLNENLESLHYEHVYEDKLSYALANLAFLSGGTSKTFSSLSNYYNLRSIKASPYNTSYWKTRAKNQYLLYQLAFDTTYLSSGIEALQQAKKISPTDPHIPYSLALYYSLQEDGVKNGEEKNALQKLALHAVNHSIDLKRNYDDAYYLKAQLLKKFGDDAGAKQTLQFLLDKVNPEYTEAIEELRATY